MSGMELAVRPGDAMTAEWREQAEKAAVFMAREYAAATAEMVRLVGELERQAERLKAAFHDGRETYSPNFWVGVKFCGDEVTADNTERALRKMKSRAWEALVAALGLKNIMSIKKREEFDRQMESGALPEIDEATIFGILLGLVGQAQEFARDAAKEVFDMLRPSHQSFGGQYKTNSRFRVGRRAIMTYSVERGYGANPFRPNYRNEQRLIALDGVFHLLAGRGVMRENRGPLVQAITASPNGKGETEFFRFKCFKNGNLHLEFRDLELVKKLNGMAVGEHVLGDEE